MRTVRLYEPEELGLKNEIQLFEDGCRTEEKSGNYEWWYFDSRMNDGSKLVIVFYTKPVTSFSAKFQPAASLNYTAPDGTEIKEEVTSDLFSFCRAQCDNRIGESRFLGDLKHYEITFKNENVECSLNLQSSVPSWRPKSGHIYFGDKDFFAWLPSVPEGTVNGTLKTKDKTVTLEGTGYHDHNWGNKLMIFLMNDWYWGRARIGNYAVISSYIYAAKKDGYQPIPIFMLAKDGKILTKDAEKYLTYEEKDYVKDPYTKRYVAHTLVYDYHDSDIHYRITYRKGNEDVERQTMKDIVGKPAAAMFYLLRFRGSYHRMTGTAILEKFNEKNEVTERIESPAMWEQMCFRPDRIKNPQ